jgi:sporulation protein YlmC with PRC-barrel domain
MTTIAEDVEVGVPPEAAYRQWTRYEESPRFMEGVTRVERRDDRHLHWVTDDGGGERGWDAEIVEDEPGRRLAWRSVSGERAAGAVTFERLDEARTRVRLELDRDPGDRGGDPERWAGLQRRRIRRDLERFKDMVESRAAEGGAAGQGERPADAAPDGAPATGYAGAVADRADHRDDPRFAGDGDEDAAPLGPEEYGEGTRLPSIRLLRGMPVRDRADDRVGKVSDVYLDSSGQYVRYLAVRTGLLGGRRQHLVPVDDVTHAADRDGERHLVIPYTRDQLRAGPDVTPDDEITPDIESSVYGYYERIGYWDRAREILAARQATPAPTPRIAEAELSDAIARGRQPDEVGSTRVRRWRS